MKAWIVMAVAIGFVATASLAQAGVPAVGPVEVPAGKMIHGHEIPVAPSSGDRHQSADTDQNASTPTIPGARKAQSAALGNGTQMAIVGGVLLVGGIVVFASHSGGGHSTTPGTGGSTGSTGTTGTH